MRNEGGMRPNGEKRVKEGGDEIGRMKGVEEGRGDG